MTDLFSTSTGSGDKPALFLHGLWGGGNYFRNLDFSSLPLGPLYFPDELGFGKSPKPDIDYTPEAHVEALFRSVPKDKKYTIIGQSFGTVLAVNFAKLHLEMVDRLILISPIVYCDVAEAKKYAATNFITNLTVNRPLFAKAICKTLCSTGILGMVSPWFVRGAKRKHIAGCTEHTWHSYYSSFTECLLKEPLLPLFTDVVTKFPTLIIYGEKDNYLASQTMAKLEGSFVTKKPFSNETHNVFFARMDDCIITIRDWLEKSSIASPTVIPA